MTEAFSCVSGQLSGIVSIIIPTWPPHLYTPRRQCYTYLSVSAANALAMGSEGSHKVGGGQKTILVSIHDTESFLELLDGGVGERFEDVSFLRHLVSCVVVTGG